jgi:tRNA U38,U39,U40 pseudouridine synthase TruA
MVRRLVFLQIQFAKGTITMTELKKGLDEKVIIKPGLAPPKGLVLTKVLYERDARIS